MESVSAILKVAQAIAKAVRTARRNADSCQELAQRAQQVAKILPSSKAVARGDATVASILRRLRSALDDALELVESCGRRRSGGCLSWPLTLVTSNGLAAKFADVNTRISYCLFDLQAANGVRIEEKIDRQAANGSRIEKKLDKLATGSRDQRRANNSQREINAINAGKNSTSNGGWNKGGGQQNGGKGGKRRRGKKAAGPPQPQFRPRAGAGVPFYLSGVHHHHSMEDDPTSCSVM